MKHRQEEREREVLERLEERRLRARGSSEGEAKRKAKEAAEWMVGQAASVKEQRWKRGAETVGPGGGVGAAAVTAAGGTGKTSLVFSHDPTEAEMHAVKRERARVSASRTVGGGLGMTLLGPHVRFGLGVVALLVCLLWLNKNGALNAEKVRALVLGSFEGGYAKLSVGDTPGLRDVAPKGTLVPRKMVPLDVPVLSNRLTVEQRDMLLNRLTWGLAGILLLVASLWRGVKMSFLILPAAVVVVCGEMLGVPGAMGFVAWQVACLGGIGLALVAYWFGREVGA
jgi:hypothetical protein